MLFAEIIYPFPVKNNERGVGQNEIRQTRQLTIIPPLGEHGLVSAVLRPFSDAQRIQSFTIINYLITRQLSHNLSEE